MTDTIKVPISGVIAFDPDACTGCGTCELACSSRSGNIINPKWSCITVHYDSTQGEASHDVCVQCRYPSCLYACPSDAIAVDEKTGARYMDQDKCVACGSCQKACPFTPDRAMIKSREANGKNEYFKCDLCKDQNEGPMCVQFCPSKALSFVSARNRKKGLVDLEEADQNKMVSPMKHDFFKPESKQEK
jgi:carbon-monoxide dehydrogenase iron sulfur subunit